MTDHLDLVMLDQEIARIAGLSGKEQRAAAVKLALRQAGCSPWALHCIAVGGIDLTMRVVRNAEGQLQLHGIENHETGGRLRC